MRYPLWILNFLLFILFLLVIVFMFITKENVPTRVSIKLGKVPTPIKEEKYKINIERIYSNDLFNTYQPTVEPVEKAIAVTPVPTPPRPVQTRIPEIPKPQFLPPLQINLKGIMLIKGTDKSTVIIEDSTSKEELTYKVGDKIKDAQLIRIFKNKVIFIRSNGQQETLFLSEKDASDDITFPEKEQWNKVTKKITENEYFVDPKNFKHHIKKLSQIIDIFDLTTAFKKGENIGCKIGIIEDRSLPTALGFLPGDIITKINNIPAITVSDRLKIYQNVLNAQLNDIIKITLNRNNQVKELKIKLDTLSTETKPEQAIQKEEISTIEEITIVEKPKSSDEIFEEKLRILKEKHKFAPTAGEIRKKERENIFKRGNKDFLKNFEQ